MPPPVWCPGTAPQIQVLHLHRGRRGHTPGKGGDEGQGDRAGGCFTCPGGGGHWSGWGTKDGGTGGMRGMGIRAGGTGWGHPRRVWGTQGCREHRGVRAASGAFGGTRGASNTHKDLGTPKDTRQDVWIAQGRWVHPAAGFGGTQGCWGHRIRSGGPCRVFEATQECQGHRAGSGAFGGIQGRLGHRTGLRYPSQFWGTQGCCMHSLGSGGTQGHWGHRAGSGVFGDTQGHPAGLEGVGDTGLCQGHPTRFGDTQGCQGHRLWPGVPSSGLEGTQRCWGHSTSSGHPSWFWGTHGC